MIHMFSIKKDIREYISLGKAYDFPEAPLRRCHNKNCNKIVRYRKHGFYERYFVCSYYDGRIAVRRYICPECGCTISVLPNYCLPNYIYSLKHIFEYIFRAFYRKGTLTACLEEANREFGLNISRQLLYHYRRKLIDSLELIKVGLRRLDPRIELPNENLTKNEKAKKVLDTMKNWPGPVNIFSQEFFEKNNKTIFATKYNLF